MDNENEIEGEGVEQSACMHDLGRVGILVVSVFLFAIVVVAIVIVAVAAAPAPCCYAS